MRRILRNIIIILILFFGIIILLNSRPVMAAATSGITNNYTYNIKNKNSGKYMNVNYGTDANGTNVNQFTNDGSIEQKFCVSYLFWADAYAFYPLCSDEGFGRVLDVLRTGGSASGSIQSGNNVDIWEEGDTEAQYWKIIDRGNGYYSIQLKSNTNLALTAIGTGNGSGSGTSSTSTGNIIVQNYTGAANQLWSFIDTPVLWGYDLVDNSKHLDWTGSSEYSRFFNTGVVTWNAYKPGVIRAVSTISPDVDVTISDYSANDTYNALTSTDGTIRFNKTNMNLLDDNGKTMVSTHEIGHALGLDHRPDINSVMYRTNTTVTSLEYMDKWNYDRAYENY